MRFARNGIPARARRPRTSSDDPGRIELRSTVASPRQAARAACAGVVGDGSPMPQPGAVSVMVTCTRKPPSSIGSSSQHDQAQLDDVDRDLRVVAGGSTCHTLLAPPRCLPGRGTSCCRGRFADRIGIRAAQGASAGPPPRRERAAQRLGDLRQLAGRQLGDAAVGHRDVAAHQHARWRRFTTGSRCRGLLLGRRWHQRVPAQQRAFDAARIVAHAGQADQLAERGVFVGSIAPVSTARKCCCSCWAGESRPLTVSVISEAEAMQMAQPWPLKRMSWMRPVRPAAATCHVWSPHDGLRPRLVRGVGQVAEVARRALVLQHHVPGTGRARRRASGFIAKHLQARATPATRRSTRRACCRAANEARVVGPAQVVQQRLAQCSLVRNGDAARIQQRADVVRAHPRPRRRRWPTVRCGQHGDAGEAPGLAARRRGAACTCGDGVAPHLLDKLGRGARPTAPDVGRAAFQAHRQFGIVGTVADPGHHVAAQAQRLGVQRGAPAGQHADAHGAMHLVAGKP